METGIIKMQNILHVAGSNCGERTELGLFLLTTFNHFSVTATFWCYRLLNVCRSIEQRFIDALY